MSNLMSQMMRRKDYPVEHEISEDKLQKLKATRDHRNLTFDEYRDFFEGGNGHTSLHHEFAMFEDDFKSRGQFLNWLLERRLKDGRII